MLLTNLNSSLQGFNSELGGMFAAFNTDTNITDVNFQDMMNIDSFVGEQLLSPSIDVEKNDQSVDDQINDEINLDEPIGLQPLNIFYTLPLPPLTFTQGDIKLVDYTKNASEVLSGNNVVMPLMPNLNFEQSENLIINNTPNILNTSDPVSNILNLNINGHDITAIGNKLNPILNTQAINHKPQIIDANYNLPIINITSNVETLTADNLKLLNSNSDRISNIASLEITKPKEDLNESTLKTLISEPESILSVANNLPVSNSTIEISFNDRIQLNDVNNKSVINKNFLLLNNELPSTNRLSIANAIPININTNSIDLTNELPAITHIINDPKVIKPNNSEIEQPEVFNLVSSDNKAIINTKTVLLSASHIYHSKPSESNIISKVFDNGNITDSKNSINDSPLFAIKSSTDINNFSESSIIENSSIDFEDAPKVNLPQLSNPTLVPISLNGLKQKVDINQSSVVEQIKIQILNNKTNDFERSKFKLSPESLGDVEIQFEKDHQTGHTNILITSEKFTTFDILKNITNQIENGLVQSGFKSDNFSLNFGMQNNNEGNFQENMLKGNQSFDKSTHTIKNYSDLSISHYQTIQHDSLNIVV